MGFLNVPFCSIYFTHECQLTTKAAHSNSIENDSYFHVILHVIGDMLPTLNVTHWKFNYITIWLWDKLLRTHPMRLPPQEGSQWSITNELKQHQLTLTDLRLYTDAAGVLQSSLSSICSLKSNRASEIFNP